jgi:AcrR family transcriptional regulator
MNEAKNTPLPTYHERLMQGLALSISEKGYVDTTIADIVRYARVSRRTFYQCFSDKRACLLYSYRQTSLHTLAGVAEAVLQARQQNALFAVQVRNGVTMFVQMITDRPRYMQVLMTEILMADAQGLTIRREIMDHFSVLLQMLINDSTDRPAISSLLTTAMVGAINELVLLAFEQNRPDAFTALAAPIELMILAIAQYGALQPTRGDG